MFIKRKKKKNIIDIQINSIGLKYELDTQTEFTHFGSAKSQRKITLNFRN